MTNAAYRTTPGSGDLRRGDFDRTRLEAIARELRPRAIAFVGKEAYRGAFGSRPELGPQTTTLGDVGLFVLPSTSPANAAVPYAERLHWFRALHDWLEPVERRAARALVIDRHDRTLLVLFRDTTGQSWWASPGGGADEGETPPKTVRRELAEEAGLVEFELGPEIWTRDHTFAWYGRIYRQRERIYLVRVDEHEPAPTIDLAAEHVHEVRWWTLAELEATEEELVPRTLPQRLRELLERGPPPLRSTWVSSRRRRPRSGRRAERSSLRRGRAVRRPQAGTSARAAPAVATSPAWASAAGRRRGKPKNMLQPSTATTTRIANAFHGR